jgi:DNA-binding NtrC family response regulator
MEDPIAARVPGPAGHSSHPGQAPPARAGRDGLHRPEVDAPSLPGLGMPPATAPGCADAGAASLSPPRAGRRARPGRSPERLAEPGAACIAPPRMKGGPDRRPDPAGELLVGESAAMATLRDTVRRVAPSEATVLISGPTGAGKENVARALHLLSARATCPFVAINCGAIPADLAEAELFGAEAGAFTGALRARAGALEQAHGGPLFLDELGELTLPLQVKLLRVLETREVTRLGGSRPRRLDVRIVAATNRDLEAEVGAGRFRADLYWRLAVIHLPVPALAERSADVPALIAHFAARRGAALKLTACGAARLAAHPWPGNVRELRNLAERALALGETQLSAESLERLMPRRRLANDPWAEPAREQAPGHGRLPAAFADARPLEPMALKALLREAEAALIAQALEASGGTVAGAGRMLGLKRTTLVEKMKRMGLKPPANEAA